MAAQATLKELTRRAPSQDRPLPPFQSFHPRQPYRMERTRPRTLPDLRSRLGIYGDLAVRNAELGAVLRWMNEDGIKLTEPFDVAALSVKLVRDAMLIRAGLPHPNGNARLDVLARMAPDSQAEIWLIAKQTVADWQAAGKSQLTAERIGDCFRYTRSCIRTKERKIDNDRA